MMKEEATAEPDRNILSLKEIASIVGESVHLITIMADARRFDSHLVGVTKFASLQAVRIALIERCRIEAQYKEWLKQRLDDEN